MTAQPHTAAQPHAAAQPTPSRTAADPAPAASEPRTAGVLRAHSYFIDGLARHAGSPLGHELPTSPAEFLQLLPRSGATAWVREHSGLVGWGELTRIETSGPGRFAAADDFWRDLTRGAEITDEVRLPGSGPVAFGSFTFAGNSARTSALIVPEVVLGRHEGRVWVTVLSLANDDDADDGGTTGARDVRTASADDDVARTTAGTGGSGTTTDGDRVAGSSTGRLPVRLDNPVPLLRPAGVKIRPGSLDEGAWSEMVARVIGRLRSGEAEKVVIARDVLAEAPEPIDVRYVLGALNSLYPSCWTFQIDGMIGATPELLISTRDGVAHSRVLAGTYRTTGEREKDLDAARTVLAEPKDWAEHRFAIASLEAALRPLCKTLDIDSEPFLLELANVIHLASDARGKLAKDASGRRPSSLRVAERLHPTAAVGGTSGEAAALIIEAEEGMDRGRYAGPVGWMDARGDGEWGIALRCGQMDEERRSLRLFAGCGIVVDSEPGSELAESQAKLAPMLQALRAG